MRLVLLTSAILGATALAGAAQAATCRGEAPAQAMTIRGPALHVPDGETLCIALGPDPSAWVPVRLVDRVTKASMAAPDRGTLMAAAFGQDVTCRIVGRDGDTILGECETAAGPVGALTQKTSIATAGRAWR